MPKNPSEIARIQDEFNYWKTQLRYGYHSRDTKEFIMSELRGCGKQLGIDVPAYNSSEFGKWLASEQF